MLPSGSYLVIFKVQKSTSNNEQRATSNQPPVTNYLCILYTFFIRIIVINKKQDSRYDKKALPSGIIPH